MAAWISSLDSGVNSAVAGYRCHAVEVRVRVEVRARVEMKIGFLIINRWG